MNEINIWLGSDLYTCAYSDIAEVAFTRNGTDFYPCIFIDYRDQWGFFSFPEKGQRAYVLNCPTQFESLKRLLKESAPCKA